MTWPSWRSGACGARPRARRKRSCKARVFINRGSGRFVYPPGIHRAPPASEASAASWFRNRYTVGELDLPPTWVAVDDVTKARG